MRSLVKRATPVVILRTVTVKQQFIANQGFLESRRHEAVSGTRMREDGKVDPEEEQVKDQRNNNKSNDSGEEVFGNSFLYDLVNTCHEMVNSIHTLSDFL